MKIDTERLIIREIAVADIHDIIEYGTDEETGQYMLHWPKIEIQAILPDN